MKRLSFKGFEEYKLDIDVSQTSVRVVMSSRTAETSQEKLAESGKNLTFASINGTLDKDFLCLFPSYVEGLVTSQPGGFVGTPELARNAEKLKNFKPRSSDVWIMTFPKSGQYFSR